MTLVCKGSRRIVVDGTAYRWRLRGRPTYFQGLAWSPCTFAVEHADVPGTTLVVTTDQPHPSNWFGHEAKPVLPSNVAQTIQLALREGWTPTALGAPFHLDLSAGFTHSPRASQQNLRLGSSGDLEIERSTEGLRVGRRRRRFMIWQWLAVLSANGGRCAYCDSQEAQTMDHLIPFADGGADDISNLVPACHHCNGRKQGRNPVNWYLGVMMKGNWSGNGSLRSGGGGQDLSLRDLYLSAHETLLGWLDHLDEVTAEINNVERITWFIDRYYGLGRPTGQVNGPMMYAVFREQIKVAQETEFCRK